MFGIVKSSFHKIWDYNNCEALERVGVMGNRNVRLVGTKLQSDTIKKEVMVCSVEWLETRTIDCTFQATTRKFIERCYHKELINVLALLLTFSLASGR